MNDLTQLTDLYIEAEKADRHFTIKLEEIIGDSPDYDDEDLELSAEDIKTLSSLESEIKVYVTGWVESINNLLANPKDRLRFNDPELSNDINFSLTIKKLPEESLKIKKLIDKLYDHNQVLKRILEDWPSESSTTNQVEIEPAKYDKKARTIYIAGRYIKFKKNAVYQPAICEAMFEDPKKLWTLKEFMNIWDSLYDYLDIAKDIDWNKVYDAIKKMNRRIEETSGVSDLFLLNTKSVQLNPKYLNQT